MCPTTVIKVCMSEDDVTWLVWAEQSLLIQVSFEVTHTQACIDDDIFSTALEETMNKSTYTADLISVVLTYTRQTIITLMQLG